MRKKKIYLKSWLDKTLLYINTIIFTFIAISIDSIGNSTYNKILIISMIIFIVNALVLNKYSKILKEEGFIEEFKVNNESVQSTLTLTLKYGHNKERVITGLKRISKPGLRVYAKAEDIPRVLNGLGIAIISTPKGIMTDKLARKNNVGGEVIAYVW